jgi:acetyl-CoA carboxylase biotin carboxylase subunit
MFSRLLIANRGEIAVRVIRACRELGIETVAVFSDADAEALHVRLADRAVRLGPAAAAESYLSVGAVIDAARAGGAEAIHPGYGFLSENPQLPAACVEAGLVFVGPPADVIARVGSKIEARRLMSGAGVSVVPGDTPTDQSERSIEAAMERVGFPVLLKPSAGGGGIGMRVVRRRSEAAEAIPGARREATAAFGDGTLYVERLVERPRHVEFQIVADAYGGVIHVFERECSIQRRHQKVIEESPSTIVTPVLRDRMGAAAVAAARAAGYRNAGTVEFLVDGSGDDAAFYFLEMNTRLQVEHPVTESVAGVDLVHVQLRLAAGEPLPWTQQSLMTRGHAIECRVYAEDPDQDFLPQAGPLLLYREPQGPGIRVDSGVEEGSTITVYYDPLVAKLIVYADTRELAIARMQRALEAFPVLGVRTNIPYLLGVIGHEEFRAGTYDTTWLDRQTAGVLAAIRMVDVPAEAVAVAGSAWNARLRPAVAQQPAGAPDPWVTLGGWRPGG